MANHSSYDLDNIQTEFIKYAPAYAQAEAKGAIAKVMDLQKQGVIRNGLYYIVLVDLVGSTDYGARHGNDELSNRIQNFITSSFNALNESNVRNMALFIKEIGDAVLFVFQHFPDILIWSSRFRKCLNVFDHTDEPYQIRTCINIGEVFLQGVNPLSLAVSQTFKMEKYVDAGQVVLTEPAYLVAWPTVVHAHHDFVRVGSIKLDGISSEVNLYQLPEAALITVTTQ